MSEFRRTLTTSLVVASLLAGSQSASAQLGPNPIPEPTPGRPGEDDKPEGVAEKAPTRPGMLPTTPVLPPPRSRKKRLELFELDGYLRFRTDWFKNFHLGFDDDPTLGGAPFREPLGCNTSSGDPCSETLKSANMRLRLEPIINIDERSSVHFQVDVLDNLVLGSTPDGWFGDGTPAPTNIPLSAFSGGQVAPEAGRNSDIDSIRVKRAWAEVMTPLGLLKFGRQPSHWGMGILANSGAADPFTGTYDLDSDYGDTADRLMFGTMIPGTHYRFAVGTDWASTKPTAAQSDLFLNRYDGQPWDLEDHDDVSQWLLVLARIDSPEKFKDILDQGDLALNYGTYFVYRTQGWDYTGNQVGQTPDLTKLVERKATAYIPDVWLKLGKGKLDFEMEAVGIFGSIDEMSDFNLDAIDIFQFGGAARTGYRLVDDKLRLGLEVGFATGDQWDLSPQGCTNVRDCRPLPEETAFDAFRFDFDYKIDLILFRELIGTVTNATYLKPTLSYEVTRSLKLKVANVTSFANRPVSTPGNGTMYGTEFDADIGYENEGFFAGIAYGILFPLGAMDHPEEDSAAGGPGFNYGAGNVGDAGNAQTIQTRLVLQF
jgi:uncharacterized protein (TIGR04551 family)